MDHQTGDGALSESSASVNVRRFVSAQRRYDNARVRDSEITKRLCYDCGDIVCGGEREYQEHILVHEAVYLAYQLYHYENTHQQDQPQSSTAGAAQPPANDSAASQKASPARESTVQDRQPSGTSQPTTSDTSLHQELTGTIEKANLIITDPNRSESHMTINDSTK